MPSSLTALLRTLDVKFCSGGVSVPPHPMLRRTDTNTKIATVNELLEMCVQAPCGVDGQTVTDINVRRTMKVGSDRVVVDWPHLEGALKEIAFQLGIPGTVTAELHDVLVYRPGDFFKPHIDSIKHPDHRATLVVDTGMGGACSGGQLFADGNTWSSSGAGSYAAWFTNVMHEVTPVASGMRVVATFNILSPYLPGTVRAMQAGDIVVERQLAPELLNGGSAGGINALLAMQCQSTHVSWGSATSAPDDADALRTMVDDDGPTTIPWGSRVDLIVGYLQGNASTYLGRIPPVPPQPEREPTPPPPPPQAPNGRTKKPAPKKGKKAMPPAIISVESKDFVQTVVDITPKTYVGLLPLRQYYGDGRIDFRQLNGADRLLMVAIHKAFNVPIEEVQVWKQYKFDGEYPTPAADGEGDETTTIIADSRKEQVGGAAELVCERGVLDDDDGIRTYCKLYGRESHRVQIVDGELYESRFEVGVVKGNDEGEPMYAYENCYIRFPLQYLASFVAASVEGTTSTKTTAVAGVKRARD